MKIRYVYDRPDPDGQFVVTAESRQDREAISSFLAMHGNRKWKFWLHGWGNGPGVGSGNDPTLPSSFNFGWVKMRAVERLFWSVLGLLQRRTGDLKSLMPTAPIFLAFGMLTFVLLALSPVAQDPGRQAVIFSGSTITTTAQTATTPCGQGSGSVGRKTLSVVNSTDSSGVVTVTAELRDTIAITNFTSGYLAVNAVATGAASSDTSLPTEAAGRFCQVSAVSASTSTITVTLRRE